MEPISQKEIASRLRKLRNYSKRSQSKLAKVIEPKVLRVMEGDTGKNVVSQLERGAINLTIEMASAYADIFDVSLDYIYGRTNAWKPEYKPIKEQLGLSDESISILEHLNNNDQNVIHTLDILLNPEKSIPFIELLSALHDHSELKNNIKRDKTWLYAKGKDYRGTISHYEDMKRIKATSDDADYISLFKITEITKKVANELKNNSETFADRALKSAIEKHSQKKKLQD